jgi:hypothetical protein
VTAPLIVVAIVAVQIDRIYYLDWDRKNGDYYFGWGRENSKHWRGYCYELQRWVSVPDVEG